MADFLAVREAASADPQFDPTFDYLLDLPAATIELAGDHVWELARGSTFSPGSRRALVAAPGVAFGLARMFQGMSAGSAAHIMEVFDSRDAAEAWLASDPD